MSTPVDIARLAIRFFDAIETGDIEKIRELYAPDAAIWHNTDGRTTTVEENLAVLARFVAHLPERRYENRRAEVFDGGFVHQHLLRCRRADGKEVTLAACLVCKVEGGRITRLDEYFDSAALAAWRD